MLKLVHLYGMGVLIFYSVDSRVYDWNKYEMNAIEFDAINRENELVRVNCIFSSQLYC